MLRYTRDFLMKFAEVGQQGSRVHAGAPGLRGPAARPAGSTRCVLAYRGSSTPKGGCGAARRWRRERAACGAPRHCGAGLARRQASSGSAAGRGRAMPLGSKQRAQHGSNWATRWVAQLPVPTHSAALGWPLLRVRPAVDLAPHPPRCVRPTPSCRRSSSTPTWRCCWGLTTRRGRPRGRCWPRFVGGGWVGGWGGEE